ncbi:hypothetical protein [Bacillus sp. T33-2]|nr:hypothetical protein [Bacillus sp. T33-2]
MELTKAIEILKKERFTQEEIQSAFMSLTESRGIEYQAVSHLLEEDSD